MRNPLLIALGFAWWGAVSLAHAQDDPNALCASCHDTAKAVAGSVHAKVGCATCHAKHDEYPHPAGVPKPECAKCHSRVAAEQARSIHAQAVRAGNTAAPTCTVCHGSAHEAKPSTSVEFHRAVPETCGMCHSDVLEQFQTSVHGQALAAGKAGAPVCTSCHGEHSILSPQSEASPVSAGHIRDTCAQCHANVRLTRRFGLPSDRVVSFDASYHGLAAKTGSQSVANCASCHGFHDIRPSKDPGSRTNAKNLPQTCGRCHPGAAGTRFAIGPVHQTEGSRSEHASLAWIRFAYSILIPATIGFMLLHNAGDFFRKLWAARFTRRRRRRQERTPAAHAHPKQARMYGFERVEHAVMAVSFIALVWTGFALKYPDQWWARMLVAFEGWWPVRGTLHRGAAILFMLVAAVHAGSLLFSRRLRDHWKEMLPARRDVPEFVLNFAYNMGLTRHKPYRSSHSYIEKAEYWAVIWGGVVMVATGLVLWFTNLSLHWLPTWALNVATTIHLYEALLATLAIVVWHFYGVIFDPEVYPLETAFLTGVSVKDEEQAQEPAAAAREVEPMEAKLD